MIVSISCIITESALSGNCSAQTPAVKSQNENHQTETSKTTSPVAKKNEPNKNAVAPVASKENTHAKNHEHHAKTLSAKTNSGEKKKAPEKPVQSAPKTK